MIELWLGVTPNDTYFKMPEFDAEDFAAEVDKYYEGKIPYTDILHRTAAEQPESTEEDLVKNGSPAPSLDEMFSWLPPDAPDAKTTLSAEERYEALLKATEGLKVNGPEGKGETGKNAKPKS